MSASSALTKDQISILKRTINGIGKKPQTDKNKPNGSIPDLGVIFFSGLTQEESVYDLLIDVAKFVDDKGFNAIWTPERHFTEVGGAYPNPSVLAAALSTVTKNIRLRSGSINLPLHNPVRVAEEWAVVDNLSGGRVDLALAPGWHIKDFVLKPENFNERFTILNEYRETLQKLWQGESIEITDTNGSVHDITTYPRPIQKHLPLWLTTSTSESSWEFAGKNNLNVLSALINFGVKDLEKRIAIYRQARLDAGLDPAAGTVSLMLHTYVGETQEKAIEKVRPALTEYLKSFVKQHQTANTTSDKKVDALKLVGEESDDFVKMVFDRYTKSSSLIGEVGHVKSVLENFKSIGVDEVACLVDFGLSKDDILNSLNLLSTTMDKYESL